MANPNPQSGFRTNPQNINKDGRPPKGYSITETFKEMLGNSPEKKKELADAIYARAKEGDPTALKLIWNYMDGMPQQKIEHSGEIKGNTIVLTRFSDEASG